MAGVVLIVTALASGCVYYNTFYNAESQFALGETTRLVAESKPDDERLKNQALQHYDTAIRKASIILAHHSDSKWVDDSLLLIGKASFWLGKYEGDDGALLKFHELYDNFPESPLVLEARYWEGRSLTKAGKLDEARKVLREIGSGDDATFASLALLALAELEVEAGQYAAAVDEFERLLEGRQPSKATRASIWKSYGDALLRQGHPSEALSAYSEVLQSAPDSRTDYETRLQIGATQELREEFDEALETYAEILKAKRFRIYDPEIRLKEAHVIRLLGDFDRAVELYQKAIELYPKSVYSAKAYYELGMIEQMDRGNPALAEELFENARDEKRNTPVSDLAEQRRRDLGDLAGYRESAGDSTQAIEPLFNMAELFLFNVGQIDSALVMYRRALALAPDSSAYAPKALFAIGTIQADSLEQADSAAVTFEALVERFPTSSYGIEARRKLTAESTFDEAAQNAFAAAEEARRSGDLTRYLALLGELATSHPRSLYAARSLFAAAWTYENDLDQPAEAEARYAELVRKYPITEIADRARAKLDGGYLKPLAKVDDTTPSDGVSAGESAEQAATDADKAGSSGLREDALAAVDSTPADSVEALPEAPLNENEVDEPPVITEMVPAEFPEDAIASVTQAEVVVRALVGADGRVVQVQPMRGSLKFQQPALRAVLQYRFRPGRHEGKPRDVWVQLTIPFEREEDED